MRMNQKVVQSVEAALAIIRQETRERLRDFGEEITELAKANAPYLTGNLKRSIKFEEDGKDMAVTARADYAAHVEFGTSRRAATPFLGPAVEQAKENLRRNP